MPAYMLTGHLWRGIMRIKLSVMYMKLRVLSYFFLYRREKQTQSSVSVVFIDFAKKLINSNLVIC